MDFVGWNRPLLTASSIFKSFLWFLVSSQVKLVPLFCSKLFIEGGTISVNGITLSCSVIACFNTLTAGFERDDLRQIRLILFICYFKSSRRISIA